MDKNLYKYFNCDNFTECIIKLKNTLTKKYQIEMYDNIYINFINIYIIYDENTIIPNLDSIIKLFILVLYYRKFLFNCNDCYLDINNKSINWLLYLMEQNNYSQLSFIIILIQMSCSISNDVTFYTNEIILKAKDKRLISYLQIDSPIIIEDDVNYFMTKSVYISNNSLNKYFYYVIIGKAGLFSFFDITNMLIGSNINNNFSKIPLNLKTHFSITDIGPHRNNHIIPYKMLIHDLYHSNGIINYLNHFNIDELKIVYNSNNKLFINRMFYILVWYLLFELPGFDIINDNSKNFNESLLEYFMINYDNINFYDYIDREDLDYIINYILKSDDTPDILYSYDIKKYSIFLLKCNKYLYDYILPIIY
jgi:hypothetical protein